MRPTDPITAYLASLRRNLHLKPEATDRIMAEVEEHLRDAAAALEAAGYAEDAARAEAAARFGDPGRLALRFQFYHIPWRRLAATLAALIVLLPFVALPVQFALRDRSGTSALTITACLLLASGMGLVAGYLVPRRAGAAGALALVAYYAFAWVANAQARHLPTEHAMAVTLLTVASLAYGGAFGAAGGWVGGHLRRAVQRFEALRQHA